MNHFKISLIIAILTFLNPINLLAQSEKHNKKKHHHCHIEAPDTLNHGLVFQPKFNCEIEKYNIEIYNRFGNKVFHSDSAEEHWSTKLDQKGSYFWVMNVLFKNHDDSVTQKGSLVLN